MKWKGTHDYLVLNIGPLKVSIMAEGRPVSYEATVYIGHKLIAASTCPTLELAKKWCEVWLNNFALDIELELGDAFAGLEEMRYEPHPDGECKILAKGEYRSHTWFVVDTFGTHLCGYVTVPYWMNRKLASHAPCHGGTSFLGLANRLIAFQSKGLDFFDAYLLGWDYNHAGDYAPSKFCLSSSGHRWTTKEVAIEARKVIDWLVTRERKYSERY